VLDVHPLRAGVTTRAMMLVRERVCDKTVPRNFFWPKSSMNPIHSILNTPFFKEEYQSWYYFLISRV
jgi:hypothetical protein